LTICGLVCEFLGMKRQDTFDEKVSVVQKNTD
jgi:hypothetical protein